ncbi:MAG: FkbM family methyltransferase [Phycisphaerae bacterium]
MIANLLPHTLPSEAAPSLPLQIDRGIIVYGAGHGGRQFAEHLAQIKSPPQILFFCDDDPARQGESIAGAPIRSSTALRENQSVPVVIACARYESAETKLRAMAIPYCFAEDFLLMGYAATGGDAWDKWGAHFDVGILEQERQSIESLHRLLADEASRTVLAGLLKYRITRRLSQVVMSPYPQYEHAVVQARTADTVVEGGAWIGDTAERFAHAVGSDGRVYCFEPTPATFDALTANMKKLGLADIVQPVNAGLGATEGRASFCISRGDSGDFFVAGQYGNAPGDITVQITTIDAFCKTNRVQPGFIKMDIEGSEHAAIEGARHTITTCKPRLAICIYHKPHDLWSIPLRLRELNPDYRFYLGQHARGITETVIYAIGG